RPIKKRIMAVEKKHLEDGHSTRIIRVVFLALLLDLLGFTLILPLLPSILDHYSQKEVKLCLLLFWGFLVLHLLKQDVVYQSLQSIVDWFRGAVGVPMETKYNNVLFGGLIGSLYSLLQFLSSPVFGAASDHHGRRPLLLLTTVGVMISYILWAVSRSFSVFLLSRVVGGVCKGSVSLCAAIIADLPCPKARNKGMAMIGDNFLITKGSSDSSGVQVLGDLLNPVALFNFSAVTRTKEPPSKQQMHSLKVLGLVYFAYLFFFSGLEFTLSFLTHQRFQFSSMQQGKMYFFIGIAMAAFQGGYARRIKPSRQIQTVRMAILSIIPAFLFIAVAWNLVVLYGGLFLYSFAAAIVVPCLSAQVSGHGTASQKGTVMGILRSLGALARALGPVVASS
ncbi:hypothetical protein P4O66_012273, partial [Electrophorus voltai]